MNASLEAVLHVAAGVPLNTDATVLYSLQPEFRSRVVIGLDPVDSALLEGVHYTLTLVSTLASPYDLVAIMASPTRTPQLVGVVANRAVTLEPAVLTFDPLDYQKPWDRLYGVESVPDHPGGITL